MTSTSMSKPRIVRGVAKRHEVHTPGGDVSQWVTDLDYAAHVVRWGGIGAGTRVLDLGAGKGNLSLACLGVGASVTAVEIDPHFRRPLLERLGARARVVIADAFDPELLAKIGGDAEFDVVISNPAWEQDYEVRFLRRGLELAPRVLGIISLDGTVSGGRWEHWRWMRKTRQLLTPKRLSFSENGRAGQEYPIAVEVVARRVPRATDEAEVVAESYYTPPARVRR